MAGLVLSGNTLYGTATGGSNSGDGTVFALNLPNVHTMPLLTWNNPAPIIYGTPLTTNQLSVTANVSGNFAHSDDRKRFGCWHQYAFRGLHTNRHGGLQPRHRYGSLVVSQRP